MTSTNQSLRLSSRRLPSNQNAARIAKTAGSNAIGLNKRQSGARAPLQLDHTSQSQRKKHQRNSGGGGQQLFLDSFEKQITPASENRTPIAQRQQQQQQSPNKSLGDRPHYQRTGTARGTRSAAGQQLCYAFEWDSLEIKKLPKPSASDFTVTGNRKKGKVSSVGAIMSRNRPRGPPLPRDNGLAANEETDMWNKILQDLRKAKEKNDKQQSLAEQIASLNEKKEKATLSDHNEMDNLLRQMLKLCEEERAVLQDEPSDVIKNLGLLTALRQASEAEMPLNRAASLSKSRKKRNDADGPADSPAPPGPPVDKSGRAKGAVPRSGSVPSIQARDGRESRDNVTVKIEEGSEGTKGTIAERSGQLVIGAEVVFKHNKTKQGVEGEGIQCIIKSINGEGHKKRYEVQDPEPNENGEQGAVYRTTATSLIPIPHVGSTSPSFPPGKQVLARYPDTTTFYRAEVTGSRKEVYRLKFEGEEDDKEMEVDKRFVLDIPGK